MNNNLALSDFVFRNKQFSIAWLIVRLYIGYLWLDAGLSKITNSAWTGEGAGSALSGFVNNALTKTTGAHPDVSSWYAYFLENVVLPNVSAFSFLVAYGEVLVGVALILGLWVGLSSFFGVLMNVSYLLAGTVSINPQMLILGILLMLSFRVAGYYGLDRFFLPKRFRGI